MILVNPGHAYLHPEAVSRVQAAFFMSAVFPDDIADCIKSGPYLLFGWRASPTSSPIFRAMLLPQLPMDSKPPQRDLPVFYSCEPNQTFRATRFITVPTCARYIRCMDQRSWLQRLFRSRRYVVYRPRTRVLEHGRGIVLQRRAESGVVS